MTWVRAMLILNPFFRQNSLLALPDILYPSNRPANPPFVPHPWRVLFSC